MMGHNTLKTARLIAQKRRIAKVRKGKMDLFTFTYENKIDRKGRVSVTRTIPVYFCSPQ